MDISKSSRFSLSLAALAVTALACGSLVPPESCPSTSFDPEAFATYFNDMQLVSAASGQPGQPDSGDDRGQGFSTDEELAIIVDNLGDIELTICITERKGGGQIVYNQTHTIQEGRSTIPLMAFESDPYVIRVIVEEVLVRNLTFFTE